MVKFPDDVELFPIVLSAEQTACAVISPYSFREVFLKTRLKNRHWYCYDVRILSETYIEFSVYGMRDTVTGGKGKFLYAYRLTVNKELTAKHITLRLHKLAKAKRAKELEEKENKIIQKYMNELSVHFGLKPSFKESFRSMILLMMNLILSES